MITTDHKKIEHRLKKKGWDKKYISKTLEIIKKPHVNLLDAILMWVILIIALTGNMILLAGILPIMISMPQLFVLFILAVIGVCFGYLIDGLIHEINLSLGHYLVAGLLIPTIATINMLFTIQIARLVATKIGIIIETNPLLAVFVYLVFFSMPHFVYRFRENKIDYTV